MKNEKQKKVKSWLVFFGIMMVVFLSIGMFSKHVAQFSPVVGASMEPTFHDEDFLMINKMDYKEPNDVKRGDIVVFINNEYKCFLIKRVVGIPGDTIEIKEGAVFVNNVKQEEPYAMGETEPAELTGPIRVNDNEFFVLGDNREGSEDSRYKWVGCVKYEDILGKITKRLFPNAAKFE